MEAILLSTAFNRRGISSIESIREYELLDFLLECIRDGIEYGRANPEKKIANIVHTKPKIANIVHTKPTRAPKPVLPSHFPAAAFQDAKAYLAKASLEHLYRLEAELNQNPSSAPAGIRPLLEKAIARLIAAENASMAEMIRSVLRNGDTCNIAYMVDTIVSRFDLAPHHSERALRKRKRETLEKIKRAIVTMGDEVVCINGEYCLA